MRILKKTTLLLLAVLFAASLAAGPAAEARSWYWLVSNDNESIYFDSYSAYREDRRTVRCWTKIVMLNGNIYEADTRYRVMNHHIYMLTGDLYTYHNGKGNPTHTNAYWRSMLLAPDMMGYTAAIKILQMVP